MGILVLCYKVHEFPFFVGQVDGDDLVLGGWIVCPDVPFCSVIGYSETIIWIWLGKEFRRGTTYMSYSASNSLHSLYHFMLGPISFSSRLAIHTKFFCTFTLWSENMLLTAGEYLHTLEVSLTMYKTRYFPSSSDTSTLHIHSGFSSSLCTRISSAGAIHTQLTIFIRIARNLHWDVPIRW